MTADEADRKLLSLANDKRKFALQISWVGDHAMQEALERGIDNEWFTLVDIGPVAVSPGRLFRIFRLTDAGMRRLAELAGRPS